jgi:hypothetical protein
VKVKADFNVNIEVNLTNMSKGHISWFLQWCSKKYRSVVYAATSAVCFLLLAIAAFAADNLAGTWKENMAKSTHC